jgi:predicted metal-dependent hydrolase
MDARPPALRQGVEEVNRAYLSEAHERLEERWRDTRGPLHPLSKG